MVDTHVVGVDEFLVGQPAGVGEVAVAATALGLNPPPIR
ncbi:hypothetical protein ABH930_004574 [Kitasatospora sp. GAS204A]|nr:hypothetical protein [Kitasatospora sp. GAS204B]